MRYIIRWGASTPYCDYGRDMGNLHIIDYRLWLSCVYVCWPCRWQSSRAEIQRDHDEEISGAYR